MKLVTRNKVDEICSISYFWNVGNALYSDKKLVYTWKDAFYANRSDDWDRILNDARNDLSRYLHNNYPERFKEWNDLVFEIRPLLEPTIAKVSEQSKARGKEYNCVYSTLFWSWLCICMEVEFSDVYRSKLYDEIWCLYKAGHFPCGWDGHVPYESEFDKVLTNGKLIVF